MLLLRRVILIVLLLLQWSSIACSPPSSAIYASFLMLRMWMVRIVIRRALVIKLKITPRDTMLPCPCSTSCSSILQPSSSAFPPCPIP